MAHSILVTGGAGFIGSNFCLQRLRAVGTPVVNLVKLTYAKNLKNLASAAKSPAYRFVLGDICDGDLISKLLAECRPRVIVPFAAESHVDRSVLSPGDFVQTNVT